MCLLFRNSTFQPRDIRAYIVGLLNKFEVAILWDEKNLLIPSLLPTEAQVQHSATPNAIVRVRYIFLNKNRSDFNKKKDW